jgi:2-(1,2-epoxy-1,2-dihydrophenyl)acetyl-CoA isomerase
MFEFIETNIANNTLVITINREKVYNALNTKSKMEIIKAIKSAAKDDTVRSIVLTAKGKAFCSGQDLNDRTVNDPGKRVDIGKTIEEEWNPLVLAIRNSEKLVIGAINGVAAGAGLSVALACDIKVAAPGTRFICGFTQIGLAPDAGLSSALVRNLGYSKALEFSLMGKPLLAEDLEKFNLITFKPEFNNFISTSTDSVAGPIVATIFVLFFNFFFSRRLNLHRKNLSYFRIKSDC